ncbi:monocarboxylate transporter 9-like isoform X2 [Mercenaria mercenaria]|uniref:monocarboxylate transporter 9-like isoform X2 n=1 Tax=Mercenaria mercenaria TaxID=6596 RepID=UPI00234EF9DD|nr:monocarboxylate transporter 9-like isoform X2 [Mercenaria mercenaria]
MAPVISTTSEDSSNKAKECVHANEIDTDFIRTHDAETKSLVEDGAKEDITFRRKFPTKETLEQSNESETDADQLEDDAANTITVDEQRAPDGGGLGRSHGLFYIKFKERFNGTATSTALVTSLTGFMRLSAGPAVSILSGRFRCRLLTLFGTVILFLGLILTGFGPNLQFLYFSYGVVAGLGRAFTLSPVPILLGYYFNKRRSLAFGLASAGFSIGGFAITPMVELLFQHYGFQGTFLILSGFALNILVSSALFRPIELHRKLTSPNRNFKKTDSSSDVNSLVFKSLEQIESGTVLGSSTISINRLHVKSNGANYSSTSSLNKPKSPPGFSGRQITDHSQSVNSQNIFLGEMQNTSADSKETNGNGVEMSILSKTHTKSKNGTVDIHDGSLCRDEQEHGENKDKLLHTNNDEDTGIEDSDIARNNICKWCCFKRRTMKDLEKKKKTKLISWSVLKDTRFQCFVFATFCFTLPSSGLFLPALAKSKGVSEIQAATLLSISAGCDTVFRVLSGIVLDLKVFRSIRPLIYNGVTFLQGIVAALYPLMTNYSEFLAVSAVDGAIQGVKNAQGAVVMMDLLGVDKLASSMAVTMAVQCIAIFLGPTVSGQLIDRYGSYDGAFYFGAGAILLGGLVMAAGNLAKHCRDRKAKDILDSD